MNTLIIYISDIHFTGRKAENEGIVINAFIQDIKKQLNEIPHKEVFVIIGGDLVQTADNKESYELFWNDVIVPLLGLGIPQEHFICVPGNHDVQRAKIEEKKILYTAFLSRNIKEGEFNDFLEKQDKTLLTDKFENFGSFLSQKLGCANYDSIGYHMELNDEWSVYCMNSSLTSYAGIDDSQYPILKDDKGHLNIATRGLYNWVNINSKKKILVLHHPFEFLTEWSSSELKKIVKLHFDLVLTGHTHEQNILCNNNDTDSFIWCMAPQLYTNKSDKLGYCIIELKEKLVDKITYREWFSSRNSFRKGIDFTEDENGTIKFDNSKPFITDPIKIMMEERFRDTMNVYGDQPLVWLDRFFSSQRFDHSYRFRKDCLLDEATIMTYNQNIKIITPAQYGLTSFAWHFILKLWKERKEFCLYLDGGLIKKAAVTKSINSQLTLFNVKQEDVKRIIIDNWTLSNKDAKQILTTITQDYPQIPILILCPMLEKTLVEIENMATSEFEFSILYMAPLQTSQIRSIVEIYNRYKHIGQNDIILKRLDADIQNFNMHRTPLNCITLLEVFSNSFDENPVNRTAVIEKVLRIIFDNTQVPTYKSLPDVKDCEFALGYYCEQMIRKEGFYFNEKQFCEVLYNFCDQQKLTIEVSYLFDLLQKNHIICQYEPNLYGFRFAYWVYYFAAMRMSKSPEFSKFILDKENYAHYPEVLEFYTGSDRTRNDAADIVTKDIMRISKTVHEKVGMPEGINPFSKLRLETTDEQVTKAIEQLETNLQKTKLPNEIKDAIVDQNYIPSAPFHQSVYKVFENYSVNYLQEMIGIASKTLRNSDYIEPEKKTALLTAITNAWYDTIRVIYLMAPALAQDGVARYDGFGLVLTDGFDEFRNNPNRLLITVISTIPYNLVRWYKDNFYSSKLAQLVFDQIASEKNPVIKHLLICIIIHEQPDGWDKVVRNYLSALDKHSFFYGNTLDTLKLMYANGSMSDADIQRTKNLILLCYTKLASNDDKMHPGEIKYINKKVLPSREQTDKPG